MTTYAVGRRAELLASWLLRLKGFTILERRWSCAAGEIDLIARRGGLLLFVEVKARADRTSALEALGQRQRQRIARAAAVYLHRRTRLGALDCRFDVVAVSPWGWPAHVTDAWRL